MFNWKIPSIIQKDSMGSLEQNRTSTTTVSMLANCYESIPSGGARNSFLLLSVTISFTLIQRAKKVLSDSPGLVDFAIGLVNSVFNLPDGQVMFYEEFE